MNDSTDPQRPGQPPRGNQEPPRPHPQDQHPQDQHPQDRNAQDRNAQDQRPQDQQQVDQEQPHVEWPARADGINGAQAEQPVATQPPAESAEPPVADGEASVAEEPAPPRRAAKPRQGSRRRAPNGAEAGGKVEKSEKSETVVNDDTPSPAPDQDATDEVKPAE